MKNRLNKIFKNDGKTFILAMDHGSGLNVLPELAEPEKIIDIAIHNGVDAIICTYGIYKRFSKYFENIPAIIRADGGSSAIGKGNSKTLGVIDVEDVVKLGGDGVVCMCFPGADYEQESIESLQHFVTYGDKWGIPICAEVLPKGWDSSNWTPDNLTFVSRVGAEMGADYIKTQYTGDKESFAKLTSSVFAPVIILGGPGNGTPEALLTSIKESLESGGAGVAIGRSIWKHSNPAAYCRAIASIIHDNATVEEAMEILNNGK